jgi:uncharacterized OsmC-like protein
MSEQTLQAVEVASDNKSLTERLNRIIDKLKNATEAPAVTEFEAKTELVRGFLTRAQIRQFTLYVDEPPQLCGTDKGPNPVELVLVALGTCQEIVYAAYAAVLGIPLDSIRITVKGCLDARGLFNIAPVPSGFTDIYYEVNIKSPADRNRIKDLVDIVNAHCPVLDTLQRPVNVNFSVLLNDERV